MVASREKVILYKPSEILLHNAKKLSDEQFELVAAFEDETDWHTTLDCEKFDIVLIDYNNNHRAVRQELVDKYKVPAEKIYTFEELRVRGSEYDVSCKYRRLWQMLARDGYRPFAGKVALIMGGGSGIGLACAEAFFSLGADVIVAGRTEKKLRKACEEIGRISSMCRQNRISSIIWDITNIKKNKEKLLEAEKIYGHDIDIVVNSAGALAEVSKSFLEVSEDGYDHIMNTNLKGMFFFSQDLIRYFLERKIKGRLVNVLSVLGTLPTVKPYGISKWGGVGLTKGLGKNYAEYDIIINGVAPGEVATDMLGWSEGNCPARRASLIGRVAFPPEIANVVVQLAGFMGDNMPGEVVVCSGGDICTSVRL